MEAWRHPQLQLGCPCCSQRSWAALQLIDNWPFHQRKACLGRQDPTCASEFASRVSWIVSAPGYLGCLSSANFCSRKCVLKIVWKSVLKLLTCFTERCYRNWTGSTPKQYEGISLKGWKAALHPALTAEWCQAAEAVWSTSCLHATGSCSGCSKNWP